jgi:hypothetical protein
MRHPAERVAPPLRVPAAIAIAMVSLANAGIAQIAQGEPMPAGEFNRHLGAAQARRQGWTASARSVALKLVGDGCCKSHLIREAPVRSRVEVTVTDQDAEDDSMRGYRFREALQKGPEGFWQIVEAGRA